MYALELGQPFSKVKTRYSLTIHIQLHGSFQLKISLTAFLSFKNTLPKKCIKKKIRIVFFLVWP